MLSTRTRDGRGIGSCSNCGAGIAVENVAEGTTATCSNCGSKVRLTLVLGNKSMSPCDGMCMSAIGKVCVCACGGVNHGKWFLPIEYVPVWEQDKARKAQAKRIKSFAARVARKRQSIEDKRDALIAANPELAKLLDDEWYHADGGVGSFLSDMRFALNKGEMTVRQIEATVRTIDTITSRRIREAEWEAQKEAEKQALLASGVTVTEGRYEFTGTIISVKEELDHYSYTERYISKALIKLDNGIKLWGTVPSSLLNGDEIKGRRVTMTATVNRSDRDQAFGFYKRPSKAKFI